MTEEEPEKFDYQYWIKVSIILLVGVGLPALIIDTFYDDIGTIALIVWSIASFAAIITTAYIGYVYVWGVFAGLFLETSPTEKVVLLVVGVLTISFICLILITYKLLLA